MQNNILLKDIHDILEKNINTIIKQTYCDPIIFAIGGSIALNLSNSTSDIDVYALTKQEIVGKCLHQKMVLDNKNFDFMFVNIYDVKRECEAYVRREVLYPSSFYRSIEESVTIRNMKDIDRPDFLRNMSWRVLGADEITECRNGGIKESYMLLKDGLRLIDIWDAHFNRAYGNYQEQIKEKENVLLRKYLYTLSELATCRCIVQEKRPVMNFETLISETYQEGENGVLLHYVRKLQEENASSLLEKEKKIIKKNSFLNSWIENEINYLIEQLTVKEDYLKMNYLIPKSKE